MTQRIITGVILGLLVLWGILGLGQVWFETLSLFVLLIAIWEWTKFAKIEGIAKQAIYILLAGCLMLIGLHFPIITLFISLIWWIAAWYLVWRCAKEIKEVSTKFRYLMGLLVIVPTLTALSMLHQVSPALLLFVLVVITVGDSGAYFVGRSLGKRYLSPVISPKKTKEGLLGGLILGGISGAIFALFLHETWEGYFLLVIASFFIVLVALLGDLFESMIKRMVGIKDSGSILPGHGGILDRLDSVFAAIPLFALLCILLHIFPGLHF